MKNWQTTAIGIITAILNVILPMLQGGNIQAKDIAVSAGIAALGYVSADGIKHAGGESQ